MIENVYKLNARFNSFISGQNNADERRKAVIYDQYPASKGIVRYTEGTRQEILSQYAFFKACYPNRSLALTCPEYFDTLRIQFNKSHKK